MADSQNAATSGFWRGLKTFFGFKQPEVSLRESLEEAIDGHGEDANAGALGDVEREMLFNVLEYGELRVDDVMVPRADIIAVQNDVSYKELVKIFADAAHSRIPVFSDNLDHVLGMVHVKDVLKVLSDGGDTTDFTVATIKRPVLFVPPSMKVMDLLAKMRHGRMHMAIVVDEYGGTDGLVTVEDIVEEIVGEIEDEHDEVEEPDLVPLGGGGYDADARLDIEEMEAVLGVDILPEEQDEDVDTLGGLVFTLAGRVPEIGEEILHESGYKFEVVDADPRRICKVRIHPPSATTAEEGERIKKTHD